MYDITFLGNAPVDILVHVDDALLEKFNLKKGDWQKLSDATLAKLTPHFSKPVHQPGGSGANTAWHLAQLGKKVAFMGLVGDDAPGQMFYTAMRDVGIDMPKPVKGGRTFTLYSLITPDGERTFVTNGRMISVTPENIDRALIENTKWVMFEGYMLGEQFPAIEHAISLAEAANVNTMVTLAAPAFVTGYYRPLTNIIRKHHLGLYFANDKELEALKSNPLGLLEEDGLAEILKAVNETPHVVTHGAKGAEYISLMGKHFEACPPVTKVEDATGAGDAFAAGFLSLWLDDPGNFKAALMAGHQLAAAVIAHTGARPAVH